MKKLILLILLSVAPVPAYAEQVNIEQAKVIRNGNTIVVPNTCFVFDLDVLDQIIPQGENTLQSVLLLALGAYRAITPEEAHLCLGRDPVEMVNVWMVAKSGTSLDRPVSRLVYGGPEGTAVIGRDKSAIRLPIGALCADNSSNQYSAVTPGKNKEWRNPDNMAGYAVVCELKSVPATD